MCSDHYIFWNIISKNMGIGPNGNCQLSHWATTPSSLPQKFQQSNTKYFLLSLSSTHCQHVTATEVHPTNDFLHRSELSTIWQFRFAKHLRILPDEENWKTSNNLRQQHVVTLQKSAVLFQWLFKSLRRMFIIKPTDSKY